MKVLFFGANGYLGRHLVKALENSGAQVLPCGHADESKDDLVNYKSVDVTSPQSVEELDFDVDFIYVFAGMTGTDQSFNNYADFLKVNELGLLNILDARRKHGGKSKVVFPSTRLVYKGNPGLLAEDAQKEAKTIYAQNKHACEGYLKAYQNRFDIPYVIYRICVPYGNLFESYSYGTIGFFLGRAQRGEDIDLYGDGNISRTFTHVNDICSLVVESAPMNATTNQIFNIGSLDNCTLVEVAGLIAKKYGVSVKFKPWPANAKLIESGDTVFDDTKLKEISGFKYKHKLSDWIKSLI